jgi:hypothetical protein
VDGEALDALVCVADFLKGKHGVGACKEVVCHGYWVGASGKAAPGGVNYVDARK